MAEKNSPQQVCEKCGTPLGRFAPAGVCARCLLEVGLSRSQTYKAHEAVSVRLVKIFKRLSNWLRRGL